MNRYMIKAAAVCTAAAIAAAPLTVKADESLSRTAAAGVAVALDSVSGRNADIKSVNNSTAISAGIAVALGNYYINDSIQNDTATVAGIEKILKLTPQEDNTQQEEPQPVVSVVDGYTNLGVANVDNWLNVREEPSLDASISGKLPMNAGCEIIQALDGWYQITSGDVTGYVSADYLLTGDAANERASQAVSMVATVNADRLMVREQPNTECTILNRVAQNEDLEVAAVLEGWVQVNVAGTTGYVSADYVNVHNALPKGVTLEQLSASSSSDGTSSSSVNIDVVEYAKQFLGNPYVWGGTSLTNGCDCSGFTMRVFEHFGYSLSRTSGAQSGNGTRVALSEIQPGDLLFYSYGGSIGHVAIYIGGGKIIHASTEKTGICIGNAYFMTPSCATRIV